MADLNFGVNVNPSGIQNLGNATNKWKSVYASAMYIDNLGASPADSQAVNVSYLKNNTLATMSTSSVVANNIQITDNGSSLNVPGAIYTTSAIAANDSSNRVATTSFVQAAVANGTGITALSSLTIGSFIYDGTNEVVIPSYIQAGQIATSTIGSYATAEGGNTNAYGDYAHAEGFGTQALGRMTHTEGGATTATASYAHAEGYNTSATGQYAHAQGKGTVASGAAQHVIGQYNVSDSTSVEIVGWGTGNTKRANIRTLDSAGNEWLLGQLTFGNAVSISNLTSSKSMRIYFATCDTPADTAAKTVITNPTTFTPQDQDIFVIKFTYITEEFSTLKIGAGTSCTVYKWIGVNSFAAAGVIRANYLIVTYVNGKYFLIATDGYHS